LLVKYNVIYTNIKRKDAQDTPAMFSTPAKLQPQSGVHCM
jgi:hypothetical protein